MPNEQYVTLAGSERQPRNNAARIGDVDLDERVEVTLALKGPELPSDKDFPRQPLSREEYRNKYAASRKDVDTVAIELERFGLKVKSFSLESRSMVVSGTLRQMQKAFPSDLGMYHHSGQGIYRGRKGAIEVPARLDGLVQSVLGLDERQVVHRGIKTPFIQSQTPLNAGEQGVPVQPADLEKRYAFPAGQASGQNIAIAEFGGGFFASDLQAYCKKFKRPLPVVVPVSLDDQPAYTLKEIQKLSRSEQMEIIQDAGEVMMDVEIIAGLCPEATITIYFSTFDQQGITDLLNQVISAPGSLPVALSISWGSAEDSGDWSDSALNAINDRFKALALLGVTVCVSSGDDGSGDQVQDGQAHVNFPASSPFVLSVGGTMLQHGTEVVWWQDPGYRTPNGGGATGGGVSTFFPAPAWQDGIQVTDTQGRAANPGRILPDVSALSVSPLYDLIFLGKDSPNGGTSASAPLLASLLARIQEQRAKANKPPLFFTSWLYTADPGGQIPGAVGCNDITSGNNISSDPGFGYVAGSGFDAASGWGTPDGVKLLNLLP